MHSSIILNPSQPLSNNRHMAINLIPPLRLPPSSLPSPTNNPQSSRQPKCRTDSSNPVNNPPYLPLLGNPVLILRISQIPLQRALRPTTLLPRCRNLPPHPRRPPTHKMPHTRRDKHQVKDIPEHRTPRKTVCYVTEANTRTTPVHHQGRYPAHDRVKTYQRGDEIPRLRLDRHLRPEGEQVSLGAGFSAVEARAP